MEKDLVLSINDFGPINNYHHLNKINFDEESQKTFFTNKNGITNEYFNDYLQAQH